MSIPYSSLFTVKVILPAYNEEDALSALLGRIDSVFKDSEIRSEVIVVNDGSTDNTEERAREHKGAVSVKVINQNPNKGLAEAVKNGFFSVVPDCNDNDIIVIMDADNTHPPDIIPEMSSYIKNGYDIVIASRYRKGARIKGLTNFRKFLSLADSLLFRIFVRIKGVRDYTCGYRAYKAGLLKIAMSYYKESFIEEKGFACMAEILLKLKKFNPIIKEVPLILRYDYKKSASKMKIWKTVKETLKMLVNYIAGR